jgi:hypothetical protein
LDFNARTRSRKAAGKNPELQFLALRRQDNFAINSFGQDYRKKSVMYQAQGRTRKAERIFALAPGKFGSFAL